ncbi:hypothetical protein BBJ28_00020678 [Nothophytophthora sp. Chile5]|nr:hypothetical protein BBJ28_00020678 [Nothophytophthora sp. Chile5]
MALTLETPQNPSQYSKEPAPSEPTATNQQPRRLNGVRFELDAPTKESEAVRRRTGSAPPFTGSHSSRLANARSAHRIRLCYQDEAYRLRTEARTKCLIADASSTNCSSNSALLAKKALRYRKVYDRVAGVDVNDPNVDVFKLLGVDWRQREATAQPPPDLLIGTRMRTRKAVTTAETLRTKILCARQLERQTRSHHFETTIRQKLGENAAQRQRSWSEGVIPPRRRARQADETGPLSPDAELEKRVNLLTTFFHEMAVHHLTGDELNGSAIEAAEDAAEERLLKHFGDIFEGDVVLHNALDEEKWSTEAGKAARRRKSTATKLPKTMASATQHDAEDKRLTFEDYENTARYIEQLMRDVEDHETLQQSQKDVAEVEREREVMAQLVASWEYTQHRIARPTTRQRLTEVEQKRRGEWMQSHYVQLPGAVASARRGDTPLRPAFIPPKQSFLLEEQSLPSSAIWEVPGPLNNQPVSLSSGALAAVGLVNPRNVETPSAEEGGLRPGLGRTFQPQRPAQRPSTAVKAPLSADRPGSSTALRSAALSRARVRRIRSARPYPSNNSAEHTSTTHRGHSAPPPMHLRQVIAEAQASPKVREGVCHVPEAFLALAFEPSSQESDESSEENDASPSPEAAGAGIYKPAEVLEADSAIPVIADEVLALANPREALRFRLSVQELVALASKVQDATADERERAEAAVEQASVHFTLPSRPGEWSLQLTSRYDPRKLEESFWRLLQQDFPYFLNGERRQDELTGAFWLRPRKIGAVDQLGQLIAVETLQDPSISQEETLESTSAAFVPTRPVNQLIAVKCSLLVDGTLVIGVDVDHCLLDATGLFLFMRQWGLHYRCLASSTHSGITHDRSQLIQSNDDQHHMPCVSTLLHPEYKCVARLPMQQPPPASNSSSKVATTQRIFHFSPMDLRLLKKFAARGEAAPSFSTLDCVTAFLAWLITRSRGHNQPVQVSTAVNVRRLMKPPLPEKFTGNAVFPALSTHPSPVFQERHSRPSASVLREMGQRIRQSIAKFNDVYIRDAIALLAMHPDPRTLEAATRFAFGPDLLFSSWRGLGAEDVSFGAKSVYVGPPTLPLCDGVVIFLEGTRGLDALVFLEDGAMRKLGELWEAGAISGWEVA